MGPPDTREGRMATIYNMHTGNILTEGLQSSLFCDDAREMASYLARRLGRSVIVEDREAEEIYRVTPSGLRWRAPRVWRDNFLRSKEEAADKEYDA